MLCDQYYLTSPELKLTQVNGKLAARYKSTYVKLNVTFFCKYKDAFMFFFSLLSLLRILQKKVLFFFLSKNSS